MSHGYPRPASRSRPPPKRTNNSQQDVTCPPAKTGHCSPGSGHTGGIASLTGPRRAISAETTAPGVHPRPRHRPRCRQAGVSPGIARAGQPLRRATSLETGHRRCGARACGRGWRRVVRRRAGTARSSLPSRCPRHVPKHRGAGSRRAAPVYERMFGLSRSARPPRGRSNIRVAVACA